MAEQIEGLGDVTAKMRELSNPKKQKNAATRSARKAMAVVRKAAVANAKAIDDPQTAERIWKNIITKAGKSKNKGDVMMRVGVRGGAVKPNGENQGANNPGGETYHFRFVEFGTSKMRAQPFLRPAFNNNIEAAQSMFVEDFKAQLDKELSR